MTIELGRLDLGGVDGYYVRITERISEPDVLHTTDKITTSPCLITCKSAKCWLIKWLGTT